MIRFQRTAFSSHGRLVALVGVGRSHQPLGLYQRFIINPPEQCVDPLSQIDSSVFDSRPCYILRLDCLLRGCQRSRVAEGQSYLPPPPSSNRFEEGRGNREIGPSATLPWRYHRSSAIRPHQLRTKRWISLELVPALQPAITIETARSPKFPGNPIDHSPCSSDPGVTRRASGSKRRQCPARPPRLTKTRARDNEISGLNRTAFDLAVYPSHGRSLATTQDSLLAAGLVMPDGTGYSQDSSKRFLHLNCPPFPSFLAQDETECCGVH